MRTFIYDDMAEVPADIRELTRVQFFGDLMASNRTNADIVTDVALRAGYDRVIRLRTIDEAKKLQADLEARPSQSVVFWPSRIIPTGESGGDLFIRKLLLADAGLTLLPDNQTAHGQAVKVLSAVQADQALRRMVIGENDGHEDLDAGAEPTQSLADISDYGKCLRFLAGGFATRFFNDIERTEWTITKSSTDIAKMRKEHDFWYLLPDHFKRHFVQPYGFVAEQNRGRYTMERLNVPDMAVQWVHGSLSVSEFSKFLDHVFQVVSERPAVIVDSSRAEAVSKDLYIDKLLERMKKLRDLPLYGQLDNFVQRGTRFDSIDAVVAEYLAVRKSISSRSSSSLTLSHSDLCFSNILFDKRTGLLKLIDPKGATKIEDAYLDTNYDLAKLSHSILGSYDYINRGLASVAVGPKLDLQLDLNAHEQRRHRALFEERLVDAGFDVRTVRINEASLFLSMLPLHADAPRKTLAFLLTAISILDELRR